MTNILQVNGSVVVSSICMKICMRMIEKKNFHVLKTSHWHMVHNGLQIHGTVDLWWNGYREKWSEY